MYIQFRLAIATIAILLSGCVTIPRPEIPLAEPGGSTRQIEKRVRLLEENWSRQARIAGIAQPILTANSDLCGSRVIWDVGVQWITLNDLDDPIDKSAGLEIGVTEYPYVTGVTPGSPAFAAGLRSGDTLRAIDGDSLNKDLWTFERQRTYATTGRNRYRSHLESVVQNASRDGAVSIEYQRESTHYTIELSPIRRCDYNVFVLAYLDLASQISPTQDILISSGLYSYAQSDSDLQSIVAHELAHVLAKHRPRTSTEQHLARGHEMLGQAMIDGMETRNSEVVFSNPTSPRTYGRRLELEADSLAMYLLARAEIEPSKYIDFWKRIPAETPLVHTHVVDKVRTDNLEAAHREIQKKIDAGLPLIPNES
ncbi:MAG: M48 family metallopeptidase [Gammaproteobacteria bacterium]|nr:M48 family metallopeptidase [Gammaproteobacteria bacterium]